jgi:hypothetical protein
MGDLEESDWVNAMSRMRKRCAIIWADPKEVTDTLTEYAVIFSALRRSPKIVADVEPRRETKHEQELDPGSIAPQ